MPEFTIKKWYRGLSKPKKIILGLIFLGLYFFSPIDIIPEAVFGPFGYIDDAILILWFLKSWFLDDDSGSSDKPSSKK